MCSYTDIKLYDYEYILRIRLSKCFKNISFTIHNFNLCNVYLTPYQ
jgi:hypothetical protein